jgi:hypothetical protein
VVRKMIGIDIGIIFLNVFFKAIYWPFRPGFLFEISIFWLV